MTRYLSCGREILVREMLAFDDALRLALDFRRGSPQMLLVVTADHETGGMGLTAAENRVDSLQYTTAGHSAAFVPLFAVDPGAARFGGPARGGAPLKRTVPRPELPGTAPGVVSG